MLLLIDLFAQIQVGFKVACTAALFERSFSFQIINVSFCSQLLFYFYKCRNAVI